MKSYPLINNITGWLVFLISAAVYTLTLEPTTSFWDCGEFISACYKMQIMHPPGAPFFMLTGRMFTLLAADTSQVAWMVNFFSGIASAFTILFLFWSITALGRKMLESGGAALDFGGTLLLMGAGAVGALAYTFSDSFWFSAVEGEVYAYSSFFTAIVFWAILKWERVAEEEGADRWLLLIAYLMGLSIGVHLLNLLAIPAICLVYYFRKYPITRNGVLMASGISIAILAVIMYGIIPGLPTLASKFDLFMVNGIGLPFGSGNLLFALLVVGGLTYGIIHSQKTAKGLLNMSLLAATFIIIGYSSYSMIVIRSHADPPINMNKPSDIFSLVSYINREQYGDRPLLYGPYFTAELVDQKEGSMKYRKGADQYEEIGKDIVPVYDPTQNTLLPRAYKRAGTQQRHIDFYKSWLKLRDGQKPTFGQNLNFLFSYQLGHMYFRYFMWNFAGRQNDVQGQGRDYERGNWISGIPAVDEGRVGELKNLPDIRTQNKARNMYYGLPLLLGLVGLFYHFRKQRLDFWVVGILFVLTGVAIVIYLNFEPLQPRERDYAYVGSFYAFAIWIGLGVMGVAQALRRFIPMLPAAALSTLLCLGVPGILAAENWDDHDRSGKYTARDFAINYLESCAPNAILFTMGDNDTYPLWYAQEVEGIRTDVRVVNLSLLGTDWYINQLRKPVNNSAPIKLSFSPEQIVTGTRDYVPFYDRGLTGPVDLAQTMKFIASDDPSMKAQTQAGDQINYFPSKKLVIPVNRANAIRQGAVTEADSAETLNAIVWEYPRSGIMKNDLIILDIIAQNNWERPIYWTVSMGSEQYLGLDDFFQLEGLTYRLSPRFQPSNDGNTIRVAADIMYKNMMEKFRWGRMNQGIYVDPETSRMTINLRSNAIRLAERFVEQGEKKKAENILDLVMKEMPHKHVPLLIYNYRMVELYHRAGAHKKANEVAKTMVNVFEQDLKYFSGLRGKNLSFYDRDRQNAIALMGEMANISRQHGQDTLANNFQKRLEAFGGGALPR